MRRRLVMLAGAAAGASLLVWRKTRARLPTITAEPPQSVEIPSEVATRGGETDPRMGRGPDWARSYLSKLLRDPPVGVETSYQEAGRAPGVKVRRSGRVVLDCWAYDDYVRAAVHRPSDSTEVRLRSFPGVETRPASKSGYVTAYVRGPEGLPALGWVIVESADVED